MTTGQTVRLPSVDRILADAACQALVAEYGRVQTLACARAALAELRAAMLAGGGTAGEEGASIAAVVAQVEGPAGQGEGEESLPNSVSQGGRRWRGGTPPQLGFHLPLHFPK